MVLAVVDGVTLGITGLARESLRLEEPAEERDAVEEEAELRRDERGREEDGHRRERDPHPVAPHRPSRERNAHRKHERDRQREPERGHGVQWLRVQFRLVDGEVDDGTERDRRDSQEPQDALQPRPGEPDEGDPDQRERKVERDELPSEARSDPAVVDVVELVRRKPRIRRDDGCAVEYQECEHRAHLPGRSSHDGGQLPAR